MNLEDSLTTIKGVGSALDHKMQLLGVSSVGELIDFLPRRYNDYSVVSPLNKLFPGKVTIEAKITEVSGRYVRRGMHVTEATAQNGNEKVRLIWFNHPYRAHAIKSGEAYFISGEYQLSHQRFAIMNPNIELKSSFPINTARVVPIYRELKGLTSAQIRKMVYGVLPIIQTLPESLPDWLVKEKGLLARAKAIETMHFPESSAMLTAAQKRLGFEEVFELTLASLLNKYELLQDKSLAIKFDQDLAKKFVSHLPFELTDAQRTVVWQIYKDMQKTQPMNRLIEGDVGSGKTVVAAMAALMAVAEGYQVAFMAPTELLARQHADTIYKLFEPLGMQDMVALLVGGLSQSAKKHVHEQISSGNARFIIGTHALIQQKVDMHKLGLVIIDEQHRFGVEQRKKLMAKAGHMPHLLSLTATPIPRSLALTLYGELDISIIHTKPAGREPIVTEICSPNSREQLNQKIELELVRGRQMFVVCPLITAGDETGSELSKKLARSAAEKVYETMKNRDFKRWRIGLLHGKMKSAEKQAIMQQFVAHELDVLVSTTVIEVGVDVPNASIMLIEAADRFGLAQIHQLRGRVGRGSHKGFCYLMMSDSLAPSKRLRALEQSNDGFKLAELDLEIRGPGAIYGTMQHGELDLRVAKLTDVKLIASARQAAQEFIDRKENLLNYKQLHRNVTRLRAVTNLN